MSREDASAGVEHLQNAARELIAAARIFLDAAEEIVDDPQVLAEVGSTVRSVVSEVTGHFDQRRSEWFDDSSDDSSDGHHDHADHADHSEHAGPEDGPSQEASTSRRPAKAKSEGPASNGSSADRPRVRRITVD